ncbi:MAG TPA: hypothetical protein VHC22_29150 [Pirellulales bacterium]|nr:hypothetical protein [Pirellulales bacterium]
MEKKPRRFAIILIVVLGLLIAYPLSIGPAVMALGAVGELGIDGGSPVLVDAFYCVYDRPLGLLPMPEAMEEVLFWWIDLWDIYGVTPYGAR